MTLDEYQSLVSMSLDAVFRGVVETPDPYDGPLNPDDPASRFVEWIRIGRWEIRDGELWKLWEQRRGLLPEPARAERKNSRGYLTVRAWDRETGRALNTMSHRVICTHYFGPIPEGMVVNHKNGVRDDNRPINLEVLSPQQNREHAAATGLLGAPHGLSNIRCRLSDEDISEMILMRKVDGASVSDIADKFGVSSPQVSRVTNGMRRPMTFGVFQHMAAKTARADIPHDKRVLVAVAGLAGEAGEVADLIKKHIGHGHDLDEEALCKEISDVLWYLAELASCFDMNLDDIAWANIDKLRKRYPDGFSEAASKTRQDVA